MRGRARVGSSERHAVRQYQHVKFANQIPGVERLRIDHLVRELELLENESSPPRGDRATVLIPERDARGAQTLQRCRRHLGMEGIESQSPLGREPRKNRFRPRLRRDVECADVIGPAIDADWPEQRVHLFPTRQQTIHCGECVVYGVTESISGRGRTNALTRWPGESDDRRERPAERIQDSIELDTHLICESPTCIVVWGCRRPTRIRNVIGVILGLEHVEDVRSERLCCLHDVRPLRVIFSVDDERRRGPVHCNAGLDQRVDEFRRGEKVGLI